MPLKHSVAGPQELHRQFDELKAKAIAVEEERLHHTQHPISI